MTTTPTPNPTVTQDTSQFQPGNLTKDNPRLSPPDDGDFTHPAFKGMPTVSSLGLDDGSEYDVDAIAKSLFDEAGIEWPGQLPGAEDEVNLQRRTNAEQAGGDPQQQPDPQQQQQPLEPKTVTVNGQQVSVDEVSAAIALHKLLQTNPNLVAGGAPAQVTEPTPPPPPPPEPPQLQLPEGMTADDPAVKFMLEQFSRQNQALVNVAQTQQQVVEEARMARIQSERDQAFAHFSAAHPDFSQDDIRAIGQATAELGIVGTMVANTPNNPVAGIVKALEVGMYQVPTIRDRIIAIPPPQPNRDLQRQKALNALGGSGGSTPRADAPRRLDTDYEMKQAVAEAFAEAGYGQGNN